jgi:Terminase RNaseH-like domain
VFVIGLDLGQKQDYTAVAVVEKIEREDDKPMLHLSHLERYALGTPYGEQMDRVAALIEKIKKRINHLYPPTPELIVDATGVGVGVVEMLKERGLKYRAVSITGGITEGHSRGTHHVPKRNLVSRAVAPFEGKRLKIARGMRLVPELVKELENFKVKVNTRTAHDSYEAWRESDHDDLVLALALACWWAERRSVVRVMPKPFGL